eukprot:scaffold10699_cov186-Ochromonas_danica.AAC.2
MEEANAEANWNFDDHFLSVADDNNQQQQPLVMSQRKPTSTTTSTITDDDDKDIIFPTIVYDDNNNNPQNHHHRRVTTVVAPIEGVSINCIDCIIGGHLAAEPITQPTLYTMLGFRMHCFRIHAVAEPKPLQLLLPTTSFNRDVHHLACVLYRGFNTDCSEEDTKNIVAILRFLEELNYEISALKLLKKQSVIELLLTLFSNECLDEEETKEVLACLSWIRNNDFNQLLPAVVSSNHDEPPLVSNNHHLLLTKLQVAVHYYNVECCSSEVMNAINQSYERHFTTYDTSNVVVLSGFKRSDLDSY